MKKIALIMLMFIGMMNVTIAQEQSSQPKMVSIPESELTEQQKQKVYNQQVVQNASEWVGLGKEIGEAFNGALSALTKNASDFATTDLGKFAMFMVAFKIIGAPIIGFVFLFMWLIISTILYFIFIRKNVLNYNVVNNERLDDKGKVVERSYRYIDNNNDGAPAALSTLFYLLSNGIAALIVFVNIF